MDLNKDILNEIIEFYNPDSIYIVGSSINKINNPNDIDVLVLFKNDEDYLKRGKRKRFDNFGQKVEVFANTYKKEFSKLINKCYAWTSLKLGKNIYGDDLLKLYNFDEYDLTKSAAYRRNVCSLIHAEFIESERYNKENKSKPDMYFNTNYLYKCYRLLLVCYIIYNKSYELTKEQIDILNTVHDERVMSEELWTWCRQIVDKEAGYDNS